jgi:hypothetical protein
MSQRSMTSAGIAGRPWRAARAFPPTPTCARSGARAAGVGPSDANLIEIERGRWSRPAGHAAPGPESAAAGGGIDRAAINDGSFLDSFLYSLFLISYFLFLISYFLFLISYLYF